MWRCASITYGCPWTSDELDSRQGRRQGYELMSEPNKKYVTAYRIRTICEVLREIYWETNNPEVRKKVEEATAMAKKMNKKLRSYARDWEKGFFTEKVDTEKVIAERLAKFDAEMADIDVEEDKRINEHDERKLNESTDRE
jgi:hypothetical protein